MTIPIAVANGVPLPRIDVLHEEREFESVDAPDPVGERRLGESAGAWVKAHDFPQTSTMR